MTTTDRPAAASRIRGIVPSRMDLTDIGFSLALTTLGVIGFDAAFGGNEAFTVGIPGVLFGVLVGYFVAKMRPPVLFAVACGLVGFFFFGGIAALRTDAIAGVLPSPDVWSGLIDGSVNGWVRLVTSVPPAGQAGNLLAIPYLAGYAGGMLTVVAALRIRRWPMCVAPPVGVLALSVLFGVHEPASLLLQGAVFGVATVAWLSLRVDRAARPAVTHGARTRVVGSVVLLAVAVLGALLIGPMLPFAEANQRYVLREHVQPPFDPSQYPSPLSRFREYDGRSPIKGTLFTVEGLPDGQRVRLAVMDCYDGYVWRASSPGKKEPGSPCSGGRETYRRVGDTIPGAIDGKKATLHFTMGALAKPDSVWIPTAGSPTAIRFTGAHADDLTDSFRFNRDVEAAASSQALVSGDTWEVDANFADDPSAEALKNLQVAYRVEPPEGFSANDALTEKVQAWTQKASSPYSKVRAIAHELKVTGAFNNGSGRDGAPRIASGHSLARLVPFITSIQPQGNDEQFAAAVAYLAQGIGIPARVVLTFKPPSGQGPVKVTAKSAHAIVEVALDGAGWVAIPVIKPDNKPEIQQAKPQAEQAEIVQPPPPTTVVPPASIPEEPESGNTKPGRTDDKGAVLAILGFIVGIVKVVAIPVIVIVGPGVLVAAIKARRRKRRRTQGEPAARIAGGWNEVVDLAKDMGTPVPPKATRREISQFATVGAVGPLAEQIDAAVFGHHDPDDAAAEELWQQVDGVRAEMLADKSRLERLRATVSLSSLRSGR